MRRKKETEVPKNQPKLYEFMKKRVEQQVKVEDEETRSKAIDEEEVKTENEERKKSVKKKQHEEGKGTPRMETTGLADQNTLDIRKPTPDMQSSDLKICPVQLKKSRVRELTKRFDSHPISSNHPPPPPTSDATLSHLMGRRPRQNITGEGTSADGKGNITVQNL